MDAREQLARLDDPPCRAVLEVGEGVAAGAVDAGKAEDVDRQAGCQPGRLGAGPAIGAGQGRLDRRRLVDPAALPVAIDRRGAQIADPAQRRADPSRAGRAPGRRPRQARSRSARASRPPAPRAAGAGRDRTGTCASPSPPGPAPSPAVASCRGFPTLVPRGGGPRCGRNSRARSRRECPSRRRPFLADPLVQLAFAMHGAEVAHPCGRSKPRRGPDRRTPHQRRADRPAAARPRPAAPARRCCRSRSARCARTGRGRCA